MKVYLVVLNWNGKDFVRECLDSLTKQTHKAEIIVVDNGSVDGSLELIEKNYPKIHLIKEKKNRGFAGGVNIGIRYAIGKGADAVALFNNDAVADKDWLKNLVVALEGSPETGIATCRLMRKDKKRIDSTGDLYTIWGMPFPRGRDQKFSKVFAEREFVFGASGGASLYRTKMLKEIGVFDEKFFAYYEDVDISFRAQLADWKVLYEPSSIAYHAVGASSERIHGFATVQSMKNLPILFWKNMPLGLVPKVYPRFFVFHLSIFFSAFSQKKGWAATKGTLLGLSLIPHTLINRWKIQKRRKVSNEYIWSILYKDMPPNARRMRRLRWLLSWGRY